MYLVHASLQLSLRFLISLHATSKVHVRGYLSGCAYCMHCSNNGGCWDEVFDDNNPFKVSLLHSCMCQYYSINNPTYLYKFHMGI